jgi:hypothetical protein
MRRPMSLSIYTNAPMMISRCYDISIGDFDGADADKIMRAMVDASLIQIHAALRR